MRRRDFLGGIGLGAAGSLLISDSANASANRRIEFAKCPSDRPLDIRIGIKPVFLALIHTDLWEGPCRQAAGKGPEQERADARKSLEAFSETLKANASEDIQLLEPVYMEYSEDFLIRPEELAKLEPDRNKTDIYIIAGRMPNYTSSVIAEAFKKPIVILGGFFTAVDAVASLNARGFEGHTVFDINDIHHLYSLLKTRKVFQQTKILIVTDRGLPPIPVASCMDVSMLKEKFGINSHFVSYREFANEMDKVLANREFGRKADERAALLIKNAEETHIDEQYVKRSFEFYYAVKNLMEKYGCNAFTVECFELCASRLAEKYKVTPCMVHTLLKDEGIASACEADLNALLTMRLLMSVANKSSFMGNPMAYSEDQISLNHSVPGIKMAGYYKPDLPFDLRHFVESGWGTKVMIDFTKLEERTVTLARLDPLGKKIYLEKGEIVDCTGYRKGVLSATRKKEEMNPALVRSLLAGDQANLIGCSLTAHIKVPDARESMKKLCEFGSHLSMVYGDYTREVRELADMLHLEIVRPI
jgi:L-fucose isomerase-like protein